MLAALLRYSRRERRAVAQEWARRSHVARSARRVERGPDADTLRRRALHDARGEVVREGVTYHGDARVTPWCVRRAMAGRTDQLEIVIADRVWRCAGPRKIARFFACNIGNASASKQAP